MIDADVALTLWPEWLPAFRHLGKRIENRTWWPPRRLIGQRIALHAGASVGGGSWKRAEWLVDTAASEGFEVRIGRTPPEFWWYDPEYMTTHGTWRHEPLVLGAVVCTARLADVGGFDLPWAMDGSVHWLLDELDWFDEPVPMRGRQGLWRPD